MMLTEWAALLSRRAFLPRVQHADIGTGGQEDLERADITGHRW